MIKLYWHELCCDHQSAEFSSGHLAYDVAKMLSLDPRIDHVKTRQTYPHTTLETWARFEDGEVKVEWTR